MAKAIPLPVVQTGFERSVEAGKKAVGTIRLPVDIDPSAFNKLNQPLGRITGLATEFEKSIAASNARVLAFGASVGILNGVANAFKSVLTNGIAVEKALAEIGTISGQSAAQLDKLGDSLFDVAKNTSQSFGVAAKAALEFSRQGLTVEETIKRTNDALTLTRFTNLSAADAVDTLTAAVNSFAASGITTTEILNKLIAVDTAFAVSAEDLANGLSRAGSIAQEVGVSFDELNGLITLAQEKTARGGAVIGNALKTIFTRIRGDDTVIALRNVGIESVDAAGNLRDVVPILTELSNKLKDLSKGERIEILKTVASQYNINILSALLSDIGNAEGQFSKAVGISLGASNEAFSRQVELNKTLDAVLNQSAVSAAELANNLAKIGVNDSLKSLIGYVNSFLDSINKLLSSDDTGGNIARGIIKGFSDVLFTVGLPVIAAIFIKLTKDIAVFGVESLQTILGINQKVKERQALEQAVTNTLISNKGIMDQILAASGNRVKQEQILLDAYNKQIQALSVIQSISTSVAPRLQGAGLSVGSGGVTRKKAAGGYLPAQEAADVSRGVGGASSSSKVVSIPNFAFGGGKKGTMIANTSEYVVPNFANGGSAIFNQDMVKAYGLPAGAKKIGAASGYVPNFAKYVYDSDRIPADKNATLKAILASSAKKNLLIAPAGAGKSTLAAGMGTFLTGAADVANATEIDILSGAARTKDGGLSKNLESIMAAVNASGGKVSYLYTKNFDILSRRAGRTDPSEGDLRSKKQLAGTSYAPLNQFDFMGMVKSKSNSFGMVRGAGGYIPNFANAINEGYEWAGKGLPNIDGVPITKSVLAGRNELSRFKGKNPRDLGWIPLSPEKLKDINLAKATRKTLSAHGKAAMLVPSIPYARSDSAEPKEPDNRDYASVEFPIYGLSETALKAEKGKNSSIPEFSKVIGEQVTSMGMAFAEQLSGSEVSKPIYEEAFKKSFGAKSAIDSLAGGLFETSVRAFTYPESVQEKPENRLDFPNLNSIAGQILKRVFKIDGLVPGKGAEKGADLKGSDSGGIKRKFASQAIQSGLGLEETKLKASAGYIPNFAQGSPLEDAIQREMAAGLDPSQIRVTSNGKLKNSKNPNGLAVINTRDEPNGKIPNFVRIGTSKAGYETSDPSFIGSGSPILPKDVQSNLIKVVNAKIKAFETGIINQAQLNNEIKNLANQSQLTQKSEKKLQSQVDLAVSKLNLKQTDQSAPLKQGKEFDMGKLLIGFSALTFVTGALEGTLKNLDNGFAEVVVSSTKIASSLASGAAIGSSLKEFGKGTRLDEFAKTLPYLGAAVMGVVTVMNIHEEALQKAIEQTKQRREDSYKNAIKSSEDPEERALKKREELKNLRARAGTIKTELDSSKNSIDYKDGTFEAKDRVKLEKELLGLQEKINIESITESKLIIDAVNARKDRNKQEFIAYDQAQKRLVVAKILNELNSELVKNQNRGSLDQTKNFARTLINSNKLTKSERAIEVAAENQAKFEREKSNLKAETLKKAIGALASESAIATVNKDQFEILLKELKANGKIEDVAMRLTLLGSSNAQTAAERLKTILAEGDQADDTLKTRQEEARINDDSNLRSKERIDAENTIIERIKQQINFTKEYRDLVLKTENERAELEAKKPIALLERDISQQQGGATKQQEYDLSKLKNRARIASEQRKLNLDRLNETNAIEDEARKSLTGSVEKLDFLTTEDKTTYTNLINEAKSAAEAAKIVSELFAPSVIENENEDVQKKNSQQQRTLIADFINLNNRRNTAQDQVNKRFEIETKLSDKSISLQERLNKIKLEAPLKYGAQKAMVEINSEADIFTETFSYNATIGFRDGLRDALDAAVSGTDDLRGALQGVAQGFLKTMQQAFLNNAANNAMKGLGNAFPSFFKLSPPDGKAKGGYIQKFAAGGMVTGGSGIRDDVPAMLSAGEYVMRKSAVQKYGSENIAKMNNGGIFLPGVRGGSAISGYDQLSKFANQTTTSGATDVLKGSGSTAFANLEDQSARLSRFGLMNEDTIKGEITSAQQQGLELIAQREAYRTQQRKAMQQQIVGTALALAVNVGVGKLGSKGTDKVSAQGIKSSGVASMSSTKGIYDGAGPMSMGSFTSNIQSRLSPSKKAYGGMIAGFNNGGGPTDDIPALLMGGEYVMDRATVRKYGKQYLDSMNSGRARRFAEGGYAGVEAETTTESSDSKAKVDSKTGTAVNININVSGSGSSTESQGQTSQGGVDYKKMGERIKAVVLETINEEKRLGGALRSR